MRHTIRTEAGFSLVEVMVAFGILGIGMLAVGSMFIASMKSDQANLSQRNGYFLASRVNEELKAITAYPELRKQLILDYGQLGDIEVTRTIWNLQAPHPQYRSYVYRWTIWQDWPGNGQSLMEVKVGWMGPGQTGMDSDGRYTHPGISDCVEDPSRCPHRTMMLDTCWQSSP